MVGFGAGVRLFDAATYEPAGRLQLSHPEKTSVVGLAFTSDGADPVLLACPDTEPTAGGPCSAEVTVFDRDTGRARVGPLPASRVSPRSAALVAASADDRWVATGHLGGLVTLRDATTLRPVVQLRDLVGLPDVTAVIQVDFSPDAALLAASTGERTAVWDVSGARPVLLTQRRTGISAAFAPDGRLLTSDQNGTAVLREPRTLKATVQVGGLPFPLVNPRFSADGSLMVTSDDVTGAGRVWSVDTLEAFAGPLDGYGAAIDPSGSAVVLGGEQATVLTLDPGAWSTAACETAGRNLSAGEWTRYFGAEPYRRTCPGLPVPG